MNQQRNDTIAPSRRKYLKRVLRYLGNILVLLSLGFLVQRIVQNIHQLPDIGVAQWWGAAAAATVIVTGLFAFLSAAWWCILRAGEFPVSVRDSYIIMGKSQIGKYLPGNVFQYVRRVTEGSSYGISPEAGVLSLGIETALIAGTATAIAAAGLALHLISPPGFLMGILAKGPLVSVILVIIVVISAAFVAFSPGIRRWLIERRRYLRPGYAGTAVLFYLLFFLGFGLTISWLSGRAGTVYTTVSWYQFASGFALSWLLGFVVPGAPGGVGIREAVFVGLFGPQLGDGFAAGLALLLRIITTLGDLLTFGLASWISAGSLRNAERSP